MSENRQPSGRCFVISPIGGEGTPVRRHADEVFKHIILPAMKKCGLEPYRSDHLSAPGRISGQMFDRILNDDLCIAVLTGHNPNVFYELAIAHSARRPVIIMLEKGNDLPFDIKDLRCVYYDFWPTPILEGEYVDALVKQVEELRASNWQVPPVSPELERFIHLTGQSNDIEFYERSADFGTDSRWLSLFTNTNTFFSIMGVSLLSWVRTKNFETTLVQKAREGCHVRVMTLHEENPSIDELESLKNSNESAELVRGQIRVSSQFFRRVSTENPNVAYRQLRTRTPNFALTLTEQTALIVQYLHSLNWGLGPHLQCGPSSAFYRILSEEFEELWRQAEMPD